MKRNWAAGLVLAGLLTCQCGSLWAQDDELEADASTESSMRLGRTILLWPVNRVVDLFDIIEVNVGVGAGLLGNLHVTRAVQVGIGGATAVKAGYAYRDVGIVQENRYEVSVGPNSIEHFDSRTICGSFENFNEDIGFFDVGSNNKLYKERWDYLAIGGAAHILVVAAEVDIGLSQLADFILGIFTIDIFHDDHR